MIPRTPLTTSRLILRPSEYGDAKRAVEIKSSWAVSCMLSAGEYPPDPQAIQSWFAGHTDEWSKGSAYRFAILFDDHMIGLVDLDGIDKNEGSLGYWLDESVWGHGLATEAASAVLEFGVEAVGLNRFRASHAYDNLRSGKILLKLGFKIVGKGQLFSHSRSKYVTQQSYVLNASTVAG